MFHLAALDDASRHLGLKVVGTKEKQAYELGSAVLGEIRKPIAAIE